MSEHARDGGGTAWVGRSIRRVEDPTLLTGQGRFTADLPAALFVRFVRSAVAAGRIARIAAPPGAMGGAAAGLAPGEPVQPPVANVNYVPISPPVLAAKAVRFVGEPIAAVVAATAQEAEDLADRVEVEIAPTDAVVDAPAALSPGAPLVHAEAVGNVVVDGRVKTAGCDAAFGAAHHRVKVDIRSRRQNASP